MEVFSPWGGIGQKDDDVEIGDAISRHSSRLV